MRSTRRKRFPGPDAPFGVVPLLFAVVMLASGCGSLTEVHPEYDALRPERIVVAMPENLTVVPLDEVGYGPLLQRMIAGPRVFRVREMIQRDLVRVLEEKGYEALRGESEPRAPASGASGSRAVLLPAIESWSERRTRPAGVRLTLRVRLVGSGGETLYEAVRRQSMRGDRRSLDAGGAFLEDGLRQAAWGALDALPEKS